MWVLKKKGPGGWYVSPPGRPASYTPLLQLARTFVSREAAMNEACGNEIVVEVTKELQRVER